MRAIFGLTAHKAKAIREAMSKKNGDYKT
jgi:hypothetical protein